MIKVSLFIIFFAIIMDKISLYLSNMYGGSTYIKLKAGKFNLSNSNIFFFIKINLFFSSFERFSLMMFCLINSKETWFFSIMYTNLAPLEKASIPIEPEPENKSKKYLSTIDDEYYSDSIIEKTASFILSVVGRIFKFLGLLSLVPLNFPEITLIFIVTI